MDAGDILLVLGTTAYLLCAAVALAHDYRRPVGPVTGVATIVALGPFLAAAALFLAVMAIPLLLMTWAWRRLR